MSFETDIVEETQTATYRDIKRNDVSLVGRIDDFVDKVITLRSEVKAQRDAAVDQAMINLYQARLNEIDDKINTFKTTVATKLGL